MRAAFYERKGHAAEVLKVGEIPTPIPGEQEVRVKVAASAVNPTDTKARMGWLGNAPMRFPRVVPHQDGAGTIDKVGANVPTSRIGERVWVYEAQWQRPFGTAAEYVVVPSQQAVPLPSSVELVEGACLGIPAMTAHRCVFADGSVRNSTVFVAGGLGAVGFYAIQLAKWGGAIVITSVGSAEHARSALANGADHAINRRKESVLDRVMDITKGAGVDRIIEVAFGENAYLDAKLLKDNGTLAAYASDVEHEPKLPFYGYMMKDTTLRLVLVYKMSAAAHQQAVADITRCLQLGSLKHSIARRFSLSDIVAAHEAMEAGGLGGKVVVEV